MNVNAGAANFSNTLSNAAVSATGVVAISQNTGVGALTQQTVNVQTTLGR